MVGLFRWDAAALEPVWADGLLAACIALAAAAVTSGAWAWLLIARIRKQRRIGALDTVLFGRSTDGDPICEALEGLRAASGASACLVAIGGTPAQLLMAQAGHACRGVADCAAAELVPVLLSVGSQGWVDWREARWPWHGPVDRVRVSPRGTAHVRARVRADCRRIGHRLGAKALTSVPLPAAESEAPARLFLLFDAPGRNRIETSVLTRFCVTLARDMAARRRLSDAVRHATHRERERISRDLHDGSIQPYLGLKFGLESLRRRLGEDHPLTRDLDALCEMTHRSVLEMRDYVQTLSGRSRGARCDRREWLRRAVEHGAALHDMEIELRGLEHLETRSPLMEDIVRILHEGISNAARHSGGRTLSIEIDRRRKAVEIRFVDSGRPGQRVWAAFNPESLSRRAHALGGSVRVAKANGHCGSVVTVRLPLRDTAELERAA